MLEAWVTMAPAQHGDLEPDAQARLLSPSTGAMSNQNSLCPPSLPTHTWPSNRLCSSGPLCPADGVSGDIPELWRSHGSYSRPRCRATCPNWGPRHHREREKHPPPLAFAPAQSKKVNKYIFKLSSLTLPPSPPCLPPKPPHSTVLPLPPPTACQWLQEPAPSSHRLPLARGPSLPTPTPTVLLNNRSHQGWQRGNERMYPPRAWVAPGQALGLEVRVSSFSLHPQRRVPCLEVWP